MACCAIMNEIYFPFGHVRRTTVTLPLLHSTVFIRVLCIIGAYGEFNLYNDVA